LQVTTVSPTTTTAFGLQCVSGTVNLFRFIQPPPPGSAPTCAEAGVLGAIAGTIGVLQATEALKYLLGKGELLIGRLLTYEALEARFREVRVQRNPECPVCGENPTVKELVDYDLPACQVNF